MYSHSGRSFARNDNDTEGKGYGRKQMAARNRLHRGITLIRKDADFPLVSHCVNRDKLRNMRQSITPSGEMLIDIKGYWAVSWNNKGRIENCRPILKGYGILEPYAMKVASTVLRRGRAGNRSFLFDRFRIILKTRQPIFTNHHSSLGVNDIVCIDTYYIKNK